MKKRYLFILLLVLPTLFVSCQKDFLTDTSVDFVVSDTETLNFAQGDQTQSIVISSPGSGSWEIEPDSHESWVTALKDGNKIQVTVSRYDGAEERSSRLTIRTSGGKKTFVINQFGTEPVLRLEEDATEFIFKKDAEKRVLRIITNSDDWRVETLGEAVAWLKWEKTTEPHTLTLDVAAFLREEENATTNRRASLFVSNGSKHLKLEVLQRGWAQFGEPIFPRDFSEPPLLTREEIIAHEKSLGHERQTEFEALLYPQDQPEANKRYIAFNTDGEQTPIILYCFRSDREINRSDNDKFENRIYFLAKKGETKAQGNTFNKEDLAAWMEFNKYKAARPLVFQSWHGPQERYERYYREDDKLCHTYKVYNDAEAFVPGAPYRTAMIEYTHASNYISVGKPSGQIEEQLLSFPTRNLTHLHKAKLAEIIAYEETQGMIPDYSHKLSIRGTYPGVEYSSLIFKQKVPDSSKKGNLIHVLYRFNSPDALDGEPGGYQYPSQILSLDPDLAGTVGSRRDIYMGKDLAYREKNIAGYNTLTIHSTFLNQAHDKCFDFVRSDVNGFTTFVRGEDLLVDVSPVNDWLTMQFYRSKKLVDSINNKSN